MVPSYCHLRQSDWQRTLWHYVRSTSVWDFHYWNYSYYFSCTWAQCIEFKWIWWELGLQDDATVNLCGMYFVSWICSKSAFVSYEEGVGKVPLIISELVITRYIGRLWNEKFSKVSSSVPLRIKMHPGWWFRILSIGIDFSLNRKQLQAHWCVC